jgi:hypothetical protein
MERSETIILGILGTLGILDIFFILIYGYSSELSASDT